MTRISWYCCRLPMMRSAVSERLPSVTTLLSPPVTVFTPGRDGSIVRLSDGARIWASPLASWILIRPVTASCSTVTSPSAVVWVRSRTEALLSICSTE